MDYGVVKLVHQSAVALSFVGFLARGLGMLADSDWIHERVARILPHIVDTILLVSGVTLAWQLRLSLTASPWLAAKLVGLVVYIGLGMIALRRGRTKRQRTVAWIAALVTFGYIVSVALTRDALGFLALLHGAG
jgi:uncharacterized membrane protein SirB2